MPERPDPLAEPEGYGIGPGQPQEHPVSPRCRADDGKCTMATCYRLWIGDVNEHVWPLDLCTGHAAQHVRSRSPMRCTTCKAEAQVIRAEAFHGHDPADLTAESDPRIESAVKWAFGGPAGPDRFA